MPSGTNSRRLYAEAIGWEMLSHCMRLLTQYRTSTLTGCPPASMRWVNSDGIRICRQPRCRVEIGSRYHVSTEASSALSRPPGRRVGRVRASAWFAECARSGVSGVDRSLGFNVQVRLRGSPMSRTVVGVCRSPPSSTLVGVRISAGRIGSRSQVASEGVLRHGLASLEKAGVVILLGFPGRVTGARWRRRGGRRPMFGGWPLEGGRLAGGRLTDGAEGERPSVGAVSEE